MIGSNCALLNKIDQSIDVHKYPYRRDAIVSLFCTCETFWRTETLGGSEIVRYYSASTVVPFFSSFSSITVLLGCHRH